MAQGVPEPEGVMGSDDPRRACMSLLLLLLQGGKTTCYKEGHLFHRLHQKWEEVMKGLRKGRWKVTGEASLPASWAPRQERKECGVSCLHRSFSVWVPFIPLCQGQQPAGQCGTALHWEASSGPNPVSAVLSPEWPWAELVTFPQSLSPHL